MEFNRQNTNVKSTVAESHLIDQGLRSYMLKVYNYMASGVFLTGIVSLFLFKLSGGYEIQVTSSGISGLTGIGQALFASPLMGSYVGSIRNSFLYELWNKKNECS